MPDPGSEPMCFFNYRRNGGGGPPDPSFHISLTSFGTLMSRVLWLEKRPLPISETQHGLWAPSAFPAFCRPATGDPQRPALTSTPSIFSLSRAGSAQITSWLPFPWPVQEPTQTCLTTVRTTMVHSAASAQAPGLESLPKGASCPWITVPSCPGPHPSPGCAHRGDRCGPAPPGVALGPG